MTFRSTTFAIAALATVGAGATALAQAEVPPAVEARQGQFQIMALNIGVLGNMARGNAPYDAAQAQAAANNLVAISSIDQSFHWPAGTDNEVLEGTRALPVIWENLGDVVSLWGDFGTASVQLAAVAGDGLEAVQGAIGPVGESCGACHDTYRAPR